MRKRYTNEKMELELAEFKAEIKERYSKSQLRSFTFLRLAEPSVEEPKQESFILHPSLPSLGERHSRSKRQI